MSRSNADTPVAIVMRSKDEQPYIEKTLRSLFSQSYKNFELYNIDSGSTDGSVEVIKAYNNDPERFIQIAPADYVPGPVLNQVISHTKHEIIVLLNSDAIPLNHEWLSTLIQPILTNQADATVSRQAARPDAHFIVAYDYSRAYDPKNVIKNPDFFSAVSCAFRRKLWEERPFYSNGYAEDIEWAKAVKERGAVIQYIPDSIVEHSHNYSLDSLYHKRYRHGIAYREIFQMQPHLGKQALLFLKEAIRDFGFAIIKGKLHTIPYNAAYRYTAHKGFYDGLRSAAKGTE